MKSMIKREQAKTRFVLQGISNLFVTKANSIFLIATIAISLFFIIGCIELSSGDKVNEEINNPERIKGIVADGGWDVTVYQSETANAYVNYRDCYDVTIEVRNDGYLHLKMKNKIKKHIHKNELKAVVEIPYIEHIKASGACDISFNGKFEGNHCKIDLSGASDVKHFEYYGNTLDLDLDGASNCSMSGEANRVKISGNGACDIRMYDLTTETLDINLSGASDTEITVNERISGKLSGASTLKYRGNADRSDLKTSGASDVKKK